MLGKLFSIYKLALITATIIIIANLLIGLNVSTPLALILQSLVILSVLIIHRSFTAKMLGTFIQKMTNEIEEIFPDVIDFNEFKSSYLGMLYDAPYLFKNIFLNFQSLIKSKSDLLNEIESLNNSLERNMKTKDFLLEISNSILDFDNQLDFLNFILEKTVQTLPEATHGCVMRNIDGITTEYIAAYGYNLYTLQKINLDLEETYIYVMSNGDIKEPKMVGDLREFNLKHIKSTTYSKFDEENLYDVNTSVSSPIIIDNKLYGMLNIDSEKEYAFTEEIIPVMKYIANQTSIALKNYMMYKKTVKLSKFDSLTGIYNRSYFEELISDYYKKALRYKENFIIALLDMNDLKIINDQYGHDAGDLALKTLSDSINDEIRDSDIFARYGGDEFILVFFNTSKEEVMEKMQYIHKKIESTTFSYNNQKIKLSFSYGFSLFPEDSMILDILIKQADTRMYQNKKEFKKKDA
ncbi:MAG: GGDEF domain-containing protein [Clostridiales bacterium]|nr:GGDEF domain-containing protein [Clostridiales bacterium]